MTEKLPIMTSDPPLLVTTGGISGFRPPNKAPTILISGVFIKFSEFQVATKSPLLMTFCRRFWTHTL